MKEKEVIIVGAGPTGLSAACELCRLGIKDIAIIEREEFFGGIPRQINLPIFGLYDFHRIMGGEKYCQKLSEKLDSFNGIQKLTSLTVLSISSDKTVKCFSKFGELSLKGKTILLATGCREQTHFSRLVTGRRPLGIYTTGSLQRLITFGKITPGKRAVIIGSENVSFSAAHLLMKSKIKIIALITENDFPNSCIPLFCIKVLKIPLMFNKKIISILGTKRVSAIEILDTVTGKNEFIECDMVIFTGSFVSNNELLHGIQPKDPPLTDLFYETTHSGIFAAGNMIHPARNANICSYEGKKVAHSIMAYLKKPIQNEKKSIMLTQNIKWIFPSLLSQERKPSKILFQLWASQKNSTVTLKNGNSVIIEKFFRKIRTSNTYQLQTKGINTSRLWSIEVT